MRTEVFGDAKLYLGDALDVLPGLEGVDHVIGDPPYEDELHVAASDQRITRLDGANSTGDLGFDGINANRHFLAGACVRAGRGWLILFTLAEGVRAWRDDIQAHGGKWDTTLAWIKPDARPRFNGQGAARGFECALTAWCGPGHRSWNAGGKRGVYTHLVNPSGREGTHPTEKPLALMHDLVSDFTQPGQIILDPFMGSGTTGIACLDLGRRFIGVERDEAFFDLACRRIEKQLSSENLPLVRQETKREIKARDIPLFE